MVGVKEDGEFRCNRQGRPIADDVHNIELALGKLGYRFGHIKTPAGYEEECPVYIPPGYDVEEMRTMGAKWLAARIAVAIGREFGFLPPRWVLAEIIDQEQWKTDLGYLVKREAK
jgi:hypothetical protein